jgi:pimeloyl-ACP methyl ester carboxylesterase
VVLAPLLPLALPLLPPERDDPVSALQSIRVPLLFVHGTLDHIVRPAHSERLHAAAHEPRQLLLAPGAVHMEALMRPDVRAQALQRLRAACA